MDTQLRSLDEIDLSVLAESVSDALSKQIGGSFRTIVVKVELAFDKVIVDAPSGYTFTLRAKDDSYVERLSTRQKTSTEIAEEFLKASKV